MYVHPASDVPDVFLGDQSLPHDTDQRLPADAALDFLADLTDAVDARL